MDITSLPSFVPASSSPSDAPVSAMGSFSRGAISMLPMGKQAYAGVAGVVENKPYTQERQELEQEEGMDKLLNPTARILGQATGIVAPAVATGGLSAPESIGEAVLQGAGVGAGFGAGNAVDTLASGGSGARAAGDVAIGAGLGAAGGAAGEALGNVLGSATGKVIPSRQELENMALAGRLGGSLRQIRALPGKDINQTMSMIGDRIRTSTIDGEPLLGTLDTAGQRLKKGVAFQKNVGDRISDIVERYGGANVPVSEITAPLEQAKQSFALSKPQDLAQMDDIINKVKNYADAENKTAFSFKKLQQLKSDLGDTAFKGEGDPVLQKAYHTIADLQNQKLEQFGSQLENKSQALLPSLKEDFDNAKADYHMISTIMPMMRFAASKEIGGKIPSLLPTMMGLSGHPGGAIAALSKNRLGEIGSGMAFNALKSLPENMDASVVSSVGGAQAAASQIPFQQKQKAVFDYIRQSNNPHYAASKGQ